MGEFLNVIRIVLIDRYCAPQTIIIYNLINILLFYQLKISLQQFTILATVTYFCNINLI